MSTASVLALIAAIVMPTYRLGHLRGYNAGHATRGDAYNDGWHDGRAVGVRTGWADALAQATATLATVPRSLGGRAIVTAMKQAAPWNAAPASGTDRGTT